MLFWVLIPKVTITHLICMSFLLSYIVLFWVINGILPFLKLRCVGSPPPNIHRLTHAFSLPCVVFIDTVVVFSPLPILDLFIVWGREAALMILSISFHYPFLVLEHLSFFCQVMIIFCLHFVSTYRDLELHRWYCFSFFFFYYLGFSLRREAEEFWIRAFVSPQVINFFSIFVCSRV